MVMGGDWTWGGEHTAQYTDGVVQNRTPETFLILLTSFTPINSVGRQCKVIKETGSVPELQDGGCTTNQGKGMLKILSLVRFCPIF